MNGRSDLTKADVRVLDVGVRVFPLDVIRIAGVGRARATLGTRQRAVDWVLRVKPEHVGLVIIPEGHDENHSAVERVRHLLHATLGLVVIGVLEDALNILAHLIVDALVLLRLALNSCLGVRNQLAVLHKQALDFDNVSVRSAVLGMELGNNGERSAGVDRHSFAIEVHDTSAVRVPVAAVLVASALEAVSAITAGNLILANLAALIDVARVERVSSGH